MDGLSRKIRIAQFAPDPLAPYKGFDWGSKRSKEANESSTDVTRNRNESLEKHVVEAWQKTVVSSKKAVESGKKWKDKVDKKILMMYDEVKSEAQQSPKMKKFLGKFGFGKKKGDSTRPERSSSGDSVGDGRVSFADTSWASCEEHSLDSAAFCVQSQKDHIWVGGEGVVYVLSIVDGQEIGRLNIEDKAFGSTRPAVLCICHVSDGTVWIGLSNGWVVVETDNEITSVFQAHNFEVTGIAQTSPQHIWTGGDDGILICWNSNTKKVVSSKLGHPSGITCILHVRHPSSPDSEYIWTGCKDKIVRVWSLDKDECVASLEGHKGVVAGMLQLDSTVWTVGCGETIRIWDIGTLECIRKVHCDGPVRAVTGDTLASQFVFTIEGVAGVTVHDPRNIREKYAVVLGATPKNKNGTELVALTYVEKNHSLWVCARDGTMHMLVKRFVPSAVPKGTTPTSNLSASLEEESDDDDGLITLKLEDNFGDLHEARGMDIVPIEVKESAAIAIQKVFRGQKTRAASRVSTYHRRLVDLAKYLEHILYHDTDVEARIERLDDGTPKSVVLDDGIVLCKILNWSFDRAVDVRTLVTEKATEDDKSRNLNLLVNSVSAMGVVLTELESTSILAGHRDELIDLAYRIISIYVYFKCGSAVLMPEIQKSIGENSSSQNGNRVISAWFNTQVLSEGAPKVLSMYCDLKGLEAICGAIGVSPIPSDHEERVEATCEWWTKNCRKVKRGTPSEERPAIEERLLANYRSNLRDYNYLFVQDLCSEIVAFQVREMYRRMRTESSSSKSPKEEADVLSVSIGTDGEYSQENREETVIISWLNILNFKADPSIFGSGGFNDGLVLLMALDAVVPGCVPWKRACRQPLNVYQKIQNCNLVVEVGKNLGMVLIGIDGKNIVDGNRKLTLAITWQMMRLHILNILASLSQDGRKVTEKEVIDWANIRVTAAGKCEPISSLGDSQLKTGLYIIHLIAAIDPKAIDFKNVLPGETPEERELNCQYAVSVARSINCAGFVVWEDIYGANAKMILLILASIMIKDNSQGAEE